MDKFFMNFDWNGFWLNMIVSSLFFILSIPLAIKFIPYFTIRLLKKKNKKYILRKNSAVIQEICEYLNKSPFKDEELSKEQLSIFTPKHDLKNHRFVGLLNINVFNEIVFPKSILTVTKQLQKLPTNEGFELLRKEKERISNLRDRLERIIEVHSLHIDELTISHISEVCLDIRSFEIKFEFNHSLDDLIEKGKTDRIGVFGILEIAELYERILKLLKTLISTKDFEIEIKKNK